MTKAPLVIVPVAGALVLLALRPEGRRRLPAYLASGLAVLPMALAWHSTQLFMHADRAGEIITLMLGQAAGSDSSDEALGILGNAQFYAGVVLYGAFPWSVVYPFALLHALRTNPTAIGVRRALVFAAAVLVFFALISKHFPWYVMPVYPFLSIAVGVWLADLLSGEATPLASVGAGIALASLVWVDVDPFGTSPFAVRALSFPMEAHWRGIEAPAAAAALALAGLAWLAASRALRHIDRPTLRFAANATIPLALLAYASLRSVAPLARLNHHAPIERTKQLMDLARREGAPIPYPVLLRRPVIQIARFHFGDDFEIVPIHRPGGTDLALHAKGDPQVLDRSIGRAGLARRLRANGEDSSP